MYRQSEKNLLNSNTSSTGDDNMVNFGLLTAEMRWRVWGTPSNFSGFHILAALLHGTHLVGVSQTAALNRGRHLYSAGRPSRWALAHISSLSFFSFLQMYSIFWVHFKVYCFLVAVTTRRQRNATVCLSEVFPRTRRAVSFKHLVHINILFNVFYYARIVLYFSLCSCL